jgi:hypothetical protein
MGGIKGLSHTHAKIGVGTTEQWLNMLRGSVLRRGLLVSKTGSAVIRLPIPRVHIGNMQT